MIFHFISNSLAHSWVWLYAFRSREVIYRELHECLYIRLILIATHRMRGWKEMLLLLRMMMMTMIICLDFRPNQSINVRGHRVCRLVDHRTKTVCSFFMVNPGNVVVYPVMYYSDHLLWDVNNKIEIARAGIEVFLFCLSVRLFGWISFQWQRYDGWVISVNHRNTRWQQLMKWGIYCPRVILDSW